MGRSQTFLTGLAAQSGGWGKPQKPVKLLRKKQREGRGGRQALFRHQSKSKRKQKRKEHKDLKKKLGR